MSLPGGGGAVPGKAGARGRRGVPGSIQDVSFVRSVTTLEATPKERLPEIAFVGASNVGKSSLINALLGRKGVAHVSKTPGRTQALNYFRIEGRLHFVDLPGYGFAKVPRDVQAGFRRLVEEYLGRSDRLALVVILVDCRRDPDAKDAEVLRWARGSGVRHVIVLTKSDKLSRSQLLARERAIAGALEVEPGDVLPFSTTAGTGRRELWTAIEAAVSA